jgi:UDPglucose 6-dehydrogenase
MALRVIGDLQGCAEIRAYDPVVGAADLDLPIKMAASPEEALIGADVLLILTDWPEFAALGPAELQAMRRPVVIDCVGVVSTPEADLPGVRLVSMGRAPRA